MTITGQSAMNKDDIERMVRDAEAHAEDDRKRKEEAEVRNNADSLVYQTEKVLKEHGDKITGPEKEAVESSLASLKTAIEGDDIAAIRSATESLMTASQSFSQRLYDAASQQQSAAGGGSSAPQDDDVIDAEIVDDEDKAS
jgi:molecular chaperone DnaK